jgi:ATP-binding cassette subfamily C (CFTR/MRP) protein 1
LLWAAPLLVTLVSILLILIMGWTMIVGVAVLFLLAPMIKSVVKKMVGVRAKRMPISDRRVNAMNKVLGGKKVAKLSAWEEPFIERVLATRAEEMFYIRKELFIWGVTLFAMVLTPVIATAAAFATYALSNGGKNVLTAADTFAVLSLFGTARFPINNMAKLLGHVTKKNNNFSSKTGKVAFPRRRRELRAPASGGIAVE